MLVQVDEEEKDETAVKHFNDVEAVLPNLKAKLEVAVEMLSTTKQPEKDPELCTTLV